MLPGEIGKGGKEKNRQEQVCGRVGVMPCCGVSAACYVICVRRGRKRGGGERGGGGRWEGGERKGRAVEKRGTG